MEHKPATLTAEADPKVLSSQYLVYADGAGVFLLCLDDRVTLGGLREDENRADVCVMANLPRKHATLVRDQGGYRLAPHDGFTLNGEFVTAEEGEVFLPNKSQWDMGEGITIRFHIPNVLSTTAVINFQSDQRPLAGQPATSVDGVILMDQNCLMGPGDAQHVPIADCKFGVILYRNKGRLFCKSRSEFRSNDDELTTSCPLESGDVISGDDFRFRIEAL